MKFLIIATMFFLSTSAFAASEDCTLLLNDLEKLSESIGVIKGQIGIIESVQPAVSFDMSPNIKRLTEGLESSGKELNPLKSFIIKHCLK